MAGNRRPDLDALADSLRATDAWYIDYAREVCEDELETMVDFTYLDGDPGHMTKGEVLGHLITHGASHRGAIGEMLENLGVAGSADMMTTFRRPEPAR